jgi:hypothetical protein
MNVTFYGSCSGKSVVILVKNAKTGGLVEGVDLKILTPAKKTISAKTNKDGSYELDSASTSTLGTYTAQASKAGYDAAKAATILVYCPKLECENDEGCKSNETCKNSKCIQIECACGYLENHVCMPYQCCADTDCPQGKQCINHACVLKEIQPKAGCENDESCKSNEKCINSTCTPLQCACGYIENHACIPYECCFDENCNENETCIDHSCVLKAPPNETVSNAIEDAQDILTYAEQQGRNVTEAQELLDNASRAFNEGNYTLAQQLADEARKRVLKELPENESASYLIEDAQAEIQEAQEGGKDVTDAQEKLQEAQKAFEAGNYPLAQQLAQEAKELAEAAKVPAAPEKAGIIEIITSQLPLIAGIILLAVVISGIWLLLRKKKQP